MLRGLVLGSSRCGQRRSRKGKTKTVLRGIGFEDGRWMEATEDCIQRRTFILAALNLRFLLPQSYCLNYVNPLEF
jgi:hypothetical protein